MLYGIQVAFVGEIVVFTCVVRGSNSMAWTSDKYIGVGGQQLQFSARENVGATQSAVGNNQTVATLISSVLDQFIISRLQIRISAVISTASVQCHNTGTNTVTSTTFVQTGMYMIPRVDKGGRVWDYNIALCVSDVPSCEYLRY